MQYKNCLHLSRRLGIPLLTKILRSTALIEQCKFPCWEIHPHIIKKIADNCIISANFFKIQWGPIKFLLIPLTSDTSLCKFKQWVFATLQKSSILCTLQLITASIICTVKCNEYWVTLYSVLWSVSVLGIARKVWVG